MYLYLHVGSGQRNAAWVPAGQMTGGDFVEVKSTACVFLVGNMRLISGAADGLKPEAVVGVQEKKKGWGRQQLQHPPRALFPNRLVRCS